MSKDGVEQDARAPFFSLLQFITEKAENFDDHSL